MNNRISLRLPNSSSCQTHTSTNALQRSTRAWVGVLALLLISLNAFAETTLRVLEPWKYWVAPPTYFMNGAAKDCVTLAEGTWENGACINAQDMPPWSTDKTASKALAYYLNEGAVSVDDHGWLKEGESFSSPYHPCGYQSGFSYGIEYMGIKELIVNFNDGSTGTMCGSRSRTIDCPIDTYPSIDNGECQCPGACFEDETCPVDNPTLPASGVKIHREELIASNGVNTLPLSLSYRSRYAAVTNYEITDGAWRHNYQSAVYSRGIWWNANGSHYVQSYSTYVMRPNGAAYRFEQKDGSSAWTSIETDDTLTQTASGWRLRLADSDATETYNASGKLVSIQQRNGLKTTLKYDTQGQLIRVTHPYGRYLTFEYDNAWHLTRIKTSDGEHYTLAYDASGNLSTITYPDQRSRQFHYEITQHLNALTGVTDEAGQRIGTYSYHADGRVYDTQRALGTGRTQFTYTRDAQGLPQTHVTRFSAQGAAEQQTYNFITRGRVTRPANISLPAGQSGYAQHIEYDAKGHKSKVITHEGRVTFYTYNAKGRVTREATYPASYQSATTAPPLGNAESVTSTQWHSKWDLPIKTAEPGSIVGYSYDALGNLLEVIETPTTDLIGRKAFNATYIEDSKSTTWEYNEKNLPISITEKINGRQTDHWIVSYNEVAEINRISHLEFDLGGTTHETQAILTPLGNGTSRLSSIFSMAESQVDSPQAQMLARVANTQSLVRPSSIAIPVTAIVVTAGFFIVGTIITNDEPITWPNKTKWCECDPPKGTICSEFHSGGTPHKLSDFEGNKLPADDEHVHTWQMNQLPDGTCIWNKRRAQKFTFNYTPVNARACQSYPSWVSQNGK